MSFLGGLGAKCQIVGVVQEKRELKSTKNAAWRGWVCKLATIGEGYEVQLTEGAFSLVNDGDVVDADCGLEVQGGRLRLIVKELKTVKPVAAAK